MKVVVSDFRGTPGADYRMDVANDAGTLLTYGSWTARRQWTTAVTGARSDRAAGSVADRLQKGRSIGGIEASNVRLAYDIA